MSKIDKTITNWDYIPHENYSLPEFMIDFYQRIKQMVQEEEKNSRCKTLVPQYVMSKQLFELLENPKTKPEIKHRILLASFVGYDWVEK